MSVGNLEEIIDDNHAIVSTSVGSEHYVSILSFVDKDQLEPGCSVLLNHKVSFFFNFIYVSHTNRVPKFCKFLISQFIFCDINLHILMVYKYDLVLFTK